MFSMDHCAAPSLVDYDPEWPEIYRGISAAIEPSVCDLPAAVEHVGSTAVPGLIAKPIIDVTVAVAAPELVGRAIERLSTLGYSHQGNGGIPGREMFEQPPGSLVHHLYLVVTGSKPYLDHVLLRDYLRNHPAAAAQYANEKRRHAHLLPEKRAEYTAAKTAMVEKLIEAARAEARGTRSSPAGMPGDPIG